MQIFGFLICIGDGCARYRFDLLPDEMDGEIIFYSDDRILEIVKEPSCAYYKNQLSKMLGKYRKRFTRGIFPEKIAFQSG